MFEAITSVAALEALYRADRPVVPTTAAARSDQTVAEPRRIADEVDIRVDQTVGRVEEQDQLRNEPNKSPYETERSAEGDEELTEEERAAREAEEAVENPEGRERKADGTIELTQKEEQVVDAMQQRDAEVRRHEQAHSTVGGQYAGSPQYKYEKGPDGRQYVVSGEVKIDVSPEQDPEATIDKMDVVIKAALAPAEPSAQDRRVAAQAQAQLAQAQRELAVEEREEAEEARLRQEAREAEQAGGTRNSAEGQADPTIVALAGEVAEGLRIYARNQATTSVQPTEAEQRLQSLLV